MLLNALTKLLRLMHGKNVSVKWTGSEFIHTLYLGKVPV